MKADAEVWDVTKTGKKLHAFVDGTSVCKGKYAPKGILPLTVAEATALDADPKSRFALCTDCTFRFGWLLREREWEQENYDAAHAEALAMNDAESSRMYVERLHAEALRMNAEKKETELSSNYTAIRKGPLTPLQSRILALLAEGRTQAQAAEELTLSRQYISEHACAAAHKFGVPTTAAAVARYSSYMAYLGAADKIQLFGLIKDPVDPAEEHANHVVEGLAVMLRERAAKLLPE
jgi:DNA-binding CsgD family transcriptional regulator